MALNILAPLISRSVRVLVFRPEIDFWYVQKQFVASQFILVFRSEIEFWHGQKSICGLTIKCWLNPPKSAGSTP